MLAPGDCRYFLRQRSSDPCLLGVAGAEVGVYSNTGHDEQRENEDAALVIATAEAGAILAVADGIGGGPAGQLAAELALRCLAAAVQQAEVAQLGIRSGILNGIERANERILEEGSGAGTTLAVAEFSAGIVRTYHVGDSLILVTGQRGKIKLKTIAHSPVGYAVESGMLDEEQAMHHEERHLISNAVGTRDMRIEVGFPLKLSRRDSVLLASDGLSDNLQLDEIVDRLRMGPLPSVMDRLANGALERMETRDAGIASKPDDLTFAVLRPNPDAG
jgi:PPM family protein phosphatase